MAIVAIDFGGTQLRAARFDSALTLQAQVTMPTLAHEPQAAVLDRILSLVQQVWRAGATVEAIGISAPCPMAYTGLIRHASVVPGWDDVPLAQIVYEAFGVSVFMENDANMGALAEYYQGVAQGCSPAVYMTLSTGVGGGVVIDGRLFTGKSGLAIEPGHLKYRDSDGTVRSLQEFVSGPGLARLAQRHLMSAQQDSLLREGSVTGVAVGQAALAGDTLALAVMDEAGSWLGLGLSDVMHMLNPEIIVLGGSVTQSGALLLDPARRMMQACAIDPLFCPDNLVQITPLGDEICLIGAAFYARDRLAAEKR